MTTVLPSGMITNCYDKKKADNNITNMTSKTGAMTNNIQKKIDNIQKLSQCDSDLFFSQKKTKKSEIQFRTFENPWGGSQFFKKV